MDPVMQGLLIRVGLPILGNVLSSAFNGIVHHRNGSKLREQQIELQEQRETSQLKLALIQFATQSLLQDSQQNFYEKLEGNRQQFQMRMKLLGFPINIGLELMREYFQERKSALSYQRQLEITEFSKQIDMAISQQNLDFQKLRFEQEEQLQRELADYNRRTQLALAAYQRETALKLPEMNKLFQNWPLRIIPSHILSRHPNQQVAPLRVIIAPPLVDIDPFNRPEQQKTFPKIERRLAERLQELRAEFYPLNSKERPIEILDGGWDSARYRGGSSIRALFEMLKSVPVLVLETEVDEDYLTFRIAYWGLGSEIYNYETLLSRLPYRKILYESAKARALKWKEGTRAQALAKGKPLNEINQKYSQDQAFNLAIIEEDRKARELGHEVERHYRTNREDFDVLYQLLESYHCIVTAVIADAHHLIHHNTPPLLAQWLPKYLNPNSPLPQEPLKEWMISTYRELFNALQLEQSHIIPDLTLRLASDLAYLEDKSWAKQQVVDSLHFWRQSLLLPSPKEPSLTALLKVDPLSLSEADMAYLNKIKLTLLAVQDGQGASEIQSLLSRADKWKEEERERARLLAWQREEEERRKRERVRLLAQRKKEEERRKRERARLLAQQKERQPRGWEEEDEDDPWF